MQGSLLPKILVNSLHQLDFRVSICLPNSVSAIVEKSACCNKQMVLIRFGFAWNLKKVLFKIHLFKPVNFFVYFSCPNYCYVVRYIQCTRDDLSEQINQQKLFSLRLGSKGFLPSDELTERVDTRQKMHREGNMGPKYIDVPGFKYEFAIYNKTSSVICSFRTGL